MSTPESLWRVMAAASVQAVFETANADQPVVNCRIAAEIRAIADEADQRFDDYAPKYTIISWLRAEANKAEKGE